MWLQVGAIDMGLSVKPETNLFVNPLPLTDLAAVNSLNITQSIARVKDRLVSYCPYSCLV